MPKMHKAENILKTKRVDSRFLRNEAERLLKTNIVSYDMKNGKTG